jgi:phage/plasmid-like protein (TIGR03299 family)
MSTNRKHVWERIGQQVEGATNAQEALATAHLSGWNVRKVNLTAFDGEKAIAVPNRFATVFDSPVTNEVEYLGVVGGNYEPIQNEEHSALLNAIIDESGAQFETAGVLGGGRRVFITMKMPETMMVGGFDAVNNYIVALNSHDGTTPFKFAVTPIRVACQNALAAAFKSATSTFSVRHTRGANGVIAEAREALELTFKYETEFEAMAESMIANTIAEDEFQKIVAGLFNVTGAKTERQERIALDHVDNVISLFNSSDTMDGIRGTRWGAYQAVTEYTDHFMNVKNTRGEDYATLRALRAAEPNSPVHKVKERAFELLSA